MKKKIIIPIVIVTFIISIAITLLYIRRNTLENNQPADDFVIIASTRTTTFSNKGMLTLNNSMLQFVDGVSGDYAYVCDRVNCEHRPSSSVYTSDCNAYLGMSVITAFIYNDYIYFLGGNIDNPDVTKWCLYRQLLNGTEREIVANINDVQNINMISVDNNYMVMSYNNSYNYDDPLQPVQMDEKIYGIVVIDLSSYSVKIVTTDSWTNQVYAQAEQCLFEGGNSKDGKSIYSVSNSTGDVTELFEVESSYLSFSNKYVCAARENGKCGIYSLDTGKYTEIDKKSVQYLCTDDEYVYLFSNGEGQCELDYYDIENAALHNSKSDAYYYIPSGIKDGRLYYQTMNDEGNFKYAYIKTTDYIEKKWDNCFVFTNVMTTN